jgi:hypothetical protein
MRVTIEGVITSIEEDVKQGQDGRPDRKITKLLLAQKGEKMQTEVRLPGHVGNGYSEFDQASFTGDLMAWKTRDGVGMLINVPDDFG